MEHRYEVSNKNEVEETIKHIFSVNPTSRDLDIESYDWEIDWVNLDDIDIESEDHKEESNVALSERRRAVEKAQLTVGEGYPLVVIGEQNTLIEGYTRYNLLVNHFDEDRVPVYRAIPTDDSKFIVKQNDVEKEKQPAANV